MSAESGYPELIESLKHAIMSGNWQEARPLCLQALRMQPHDPGLLYYGGALEIQAGNNEEARRLLSQLIDMQPDHEDARFRLGLACLNLGDEQGAVANFHPLLENRTAQGYLGRIYHKHGAHAAAVLAFENAVTTGSFEWMDGLATACLEAGLYDRAEGIMRELIQNPDAPCDHRWMAKIYGLHLIRHRRWDDLFFFFGPLTHRPELLIVARTLLAAAYLESGNVSAAVGIFPPNAVQTNWSHTFVVVSISQFRRLLELKGIELPRRPHPYPDSDVGVTAGSLGYYGRFTHQMYEYLFLRWHADRTGVPLETPEWVGRYVFDLDDPLPAGRRIPVHRHSSWIEEQVAAKGAQALAGFDFFSPCGFTSWRPEYTIKARELFRIRPLWLPVLTPLLDALRMRGKTIVSIHFRLTDYLKVTPSPPTAWYLEWLRAVWPTLDDPVLYLASDDLDAVLEDFAEFSPCSLKDVASPWPGLEWFQEFFILMHSDLLAVSIGGFGLFAAMLNVTGTAFVRPDAEEGRMAPFYPLEHGITG